MNPATAPGKFSPEGWGVDGTPVLVVSVQVAEEAWCYGRAGSAARSQRAVPLKVEGLHGIHFSIVLRGSHRGSHRVSHRGQP